MLKFAMLTLVAAVSAVGAAQTVVALDPARGASALVATLREAPAPALRPAEAAAIAKASDGHYWAQGDVNGASVRFLVDTGASAVALTPADAERLGFAGLLVNRKAYADGAQELRERLGATGRLEAWKSPDGTFLFIRLHPVAAPVYPEDLDLPATGTEADLS